MTPESATCASHSAGNAVPPAAFLCFPNVRFHCERFLAKARLPPIATCAVTGIKVRIGLEADVRLGWPLANAFVVQASLLRLMRSDLLPLLFGVVEHHSRT